MLSKHLGSLRHREFLHVFLFAITASLLAASNSSAQNAAPLARAVAIASAPYTIKKPGVYVVTKDLTIPATSAFAITIDSSAGNVVLDLAGYTLSTKAPGNSLNTSIGIQVSGSGTITVRNGVVTGFNQGVLVSSNVTQTAILIENITAINCGTEAIMVNDGGDTTVRHCVIQDTGFNTSNTHYGINVISRNVQVSDCRVANTISTNNSFFGGVGIGTFAVASSVISNCIVTGDGGSNSNGISIGNATTSNVAVSNTLFDCAIGLLFSLTDGKYEGNLTENCNTPFSGGTSVGTNN
jgi:hypothetical protein